MIPITPIGRWISLDSHIDTLYAFAKKVVCYKKPSSAFTIHLSTKCKRILFLLYRRTMKMQICSTVNIVMNIYEVQCHMLMMSTLSTFENVLTVVLSGVHC